MAGTAKIAGVLHGALRLALAGVLLYAGGAKIIDPAGFVADLGNYQLVPDAVAYGAGLLIPWIEVLCAAALLARSWRLGGWFLAFLLGAGFTFFVASAWLRGLDISCGCFGTGVRTPVTAWATLRTFLYPLAAAAGYWYEPQRRAAARVAGSGP